MDAIYTLKEQADGAVVRYVGVTSQRLVNRLRAHLVDARTPGKTNRRLEWISSLKTVPKIEILEWILPEQREAREKYWIALFREYGHDLVNSTSGGQGSVRHNSYLRGEAHPNFGKPGKFLGGKHTPEARHKISAAAKSRPGSHLGKTFPLEHCEHLRIAILKTPPHTALPKGVHWCKTKRKFIAQLDFRGKNMNLGGYDTYEEAGLARDIAVVMHCPFGSYLNYLPAPASATGPNFCSTFQ